MAHGSTTSAALVTLDPYQCIPKRNRKYASECTEVHLAKQGAEAVSKDFEHFASLEVIWFSGNRLSRIENLESNFRIREVYVENNRLVSLSGLKSFKFLRVLLASGNQLRNLDKQLALLSRFAFLKKLDLFDNPVAEEPDYRLRLIYHVPQVDILDKHAVKGPERLRADEVVPNLDKVSATKAEKPKRRIMTHSALELNCFREAREIRERRRKENDANTGEAFSTGLDLAAPPPEARAIRDNREKWAGLRTLDRTSKDDEAADRTLGTTMPTGGKTLLLGTGGDKTLASCGSAVLRPQMTATGYPLALGLHARPAKARADYFTQSFLHPVKTSDESTGRVAITAGHEHHHTLLCS